MIGIGCMDVDYPGRDETWDLETGCNSRIVDTLILCLMCAAGGDGECKGSVKCMGYFLPIGSQASAAVEKIAY